MRAFLAARPEWEVVIPESPADSGVSADSEAPAAPGAAAPDRGADA